MPFSSPEASQFESYCESRYDSWMNHFAESQPDVAKAPQHKMVYCSQCGRGFGPGNHGFSSCKDHKGKSVIED